jgi:hypothetical protein
MQKLFLPAAAMLLLCSFHFADSPLKGSWEYRGGIINGKLDAAPTAYKLQRDYNDEHYKAKVIEEGRKPRYMKKVIIS